MRVTRLLMRSLCLSLVVAAWANSTICHAEDDLSVIFAVDEVQTEVEELPMAADEDIIPITSEPDQGFLISVPETETVVESPITNQPQAATETVRERYPNRRTKVERQVTQDQNDNYVNHGSWKMWDPQGNLVTEGEYRFGKRHGAWTRWYRPGATKLLSSPPFDQFHGPYISQAAFTDGKLDGRWIIYDTKQRKICDWEFANGRRHGKSAWWYANGKKMREITYTDGEIHGELKEWNRTGEIVTNDGYENGRRLAKKTETFKNGQKQTEGTVLHARLVVKDTDDWEECTIATYTQEGEDEKHGTWTTWFPNGQRKLQGEYRYDRPMGTFTWWHENGQKSLQAFYEGGKQHGVWTWWHENGQKSIQGNYVHGGPTGRWTWWHQTGKVAQRADFTDSKGKIVKLPTDGGAGGSVTSLSREQPVRK